MNTPYGNDSLFDLFLARRKITPEDYRAFDDGSHAPLLRIDEMCSALRYAFENKEKIVILPDFDCDGIMSGVIGYAGLSELGFNVSLFHPDPSLGYGFGISEVDRLVSEYKDVKWVLTCDTGISELEGCSYLHKLGIKILVTDHHVESFDVSVRKYAECVVDPCCFDEVYELREICGAHVLWQVLDAYVRRYGTPQEIDAIWRLRVFAGIGTVSDLMLLAHENRQLVRDAVSIARMIWSAGDIWFFDHLIGCDTYKRAFFGLASLFDAFADARSLYATSAIDETFFGFYLAPAINSCKRLGFTTDTVFGIFFGENQRACAKALMDYNAERKAITDTLFATAMSTVQPYAPYMYLLPSAKSGMLGLVASKIAEKTGLPTFVATVDTRDFSVYGSGRSPEWYPCLTRVNGHHARLAGHEHAFGFSCNNMNEFASLFAYLDKDVPKVKGDYDKYLAEAGIEEVPQYDIVIDTDGNGDTDLDINVLSDFVETQETYRPFGVGFDAPKMLVRFNWHEASMRRIGSTGEHVRINLPRNFVAMCFFQAEEFPSIRTGSQEFIGTLGFNEFRGETSLQFLGKCLF